MSFTINRKNELICQENAYSGLEWAIMERIFLLLRALCLGFINQKKKELLLFVFFYLNFNNDSQTRSYCVFN